MQMAVLLDILSPSTRTMTIFAQNVNPLVKSVLIQLPPAHLVIRVLQLSICIMESVLQLVLQGMQE